MKTNLKLRNFLSLVFLICGPSTYFSTSPIDTVFRIENMQIVEEAGTSKHFFHPYMQTVFVFVSESFCLIVFLLLRRYRRDNPQQQSIQHIEQRKKPMKYYLLALPASGDFLGSMLANVALNFIPGSIYQLLKGGLLITTAGFSYLLTKKKIKRNHIVGCLLALMGLAVVGSYNIIVAEKSSDPDIVLPRIMQTLELFGYGLLLVSLVFTGFYFSYQQKILAEYDIDPLQMVGVEGLFNLIYCAIAVPLLTFLPCPFSNNSLCVLTSDGSRHMQRPDVLVKQMFENTLILWMILTYIVVWAIYYFVGVKITQEINALARSLLKLTMTLVIWVVGIIVTSTAGRNDRQYQWEHLTFWAISVQLLGFALLIFGTLLYNENIELKWLSKSNQPTVSQGSLLTDSGQ